MSHSKISCEKDVRSRSIQVNRQIDDSFFLCHIGQLVLVQPSQSCHMQVGHDVRTDLQLVVDANGALELELLNAEAEVVHGDGVVGVADVDV